MSAASSAPLRDSRFEGRRGQGWAKVRDTASLCLHGPAQEQLFSPLFRKFSSWGEEMPPGQIPSRGEGNLGRGLGPGLP